MTDEELSRALEVEAERDQLRIATTWRPIENAPKDETSILATKGDVLGGFPQVVYWLNGKWRVDDANIEYHPEFFTHWMPLPEPPKP